MLPVLENRLAQGQIQGGGDLDILFVSQAQPGLVPGHGGVEAAVVRHLRGRVLSRIGFMGLKQLS